MLEERNGCDTVIASYLGLRIHCRNFFKQYLNAFKKSF